MAEHGKYLILPSLLSADFLFLHNEISQVLEAGADMLHFDVMDNHYVPNLTFGPLICQAIHQKFPKVGLDVHLMTTPTDQLIADFAASGATRISIHPDATIHLDRSLQLIKSFNLSAGIALNPASSPEVITWCQQYLDFVLVMTVNPGFGGQKLIPEVLDKVQKIAVSYPQLSICIDGGVTPNNIKNLVMAGAQEFVAGSAIFNSNCYKTTIHAMREQLTIK